MSPAEALRVYAASEAARLFGEAIEGERRRAEPCARAVGRGRRVGEFEAGVVGRVLLPSPWTETVKVVGDRALVCYENPLTTEYLPYPADGRSVEQVRAAFVRDLLEGGSPEGPEE